MKYSLDVTYGDGLLTDDGPEMTGEYYGAELGSVEEAISAAKYLAENLHNMGGYDDVVYRVNESEGPFRTMATVSVATLEVDITADGGEAAQAAGKDVEDD